MPLRQSVEEIRLGRSTKRGCTTRANETRDTIGSVHHRVNKGVTVYSLYTHHKTTKDYLNFSLYDSLLISDYGTLTRLED